VAISEADRNHLEAELAQIEDLIIDGRPAEAENALDRLRKHVAVLVGDDEIALRFREDEGTLALTFGRFDTALEIQRSLLSDYARLRGPADPSTVEKRWDLALVIAANFVNEPCPDVLAEARSLAATVVDDLTRSNGATDPETLEARSQLGMLIFKSGQETEALTILAETFNDASTFHGGESEVTVSVGMALIAVMSGAQIDPARLRRHVDLLRSTTIVYQGDDTPSSVMVAYVDSGLLIREGKISQGLALLDRTVDAATRVFGAGSPITVEMINQRFMSGEEK
jgi:hypothetical protein